VAGSHQADRSRAVAHGRPERGVAMQGLNISREMNIWESSFFGDPIILASNYEDAYVSLRSLVDGMRLSWSSQYWKVKKSFGLFDIEKNGSERPLKPITALHRNNVEKFLATINPAKIPTDKIEKILLYKKEFIDFFFCETFTISEEKSMDFYLDTKKGRECLLIDAVKLQNNGVYKHLGAIVNKLLESDDLKDNELRASNHLIEIAEITAKNQHRLRSA
jgi:hypothetical protein